MGRDGPYLILSNYKRLGLHCREPTILEGDQ